MTFILYRIKTEIKHFLFNVTAVLYDNLILEEMRPADFLNL